MKFQKLDSCCFTFTEWLRFTFEYVFHQITVIELERRKNHLVKRLKFIFHRHTLMHIVRVRQSQVTSKTMEN